MDWQNLFDQGKLKVENSVHDLIQTGVPAIQSGIEQWGIAVLQKQNQATQKSLEDGIANIKGEPGSPIGTAISHSTQNAVFKTYGLEIVLGAAGIMVLGFLLLRK